MTTQKALTFDRDNGGKVLQLGLLVSLFVQPWMAGGLSVPMAARTTL